MSRKEIEVAETEFHTGYPRGLHYHRTLGERLMPLVSPWLAFGGSWLAALLLHHLWGNPDALPWASSGLTLAGALLVGVTWHVAGSSRIRIHATVTVAAVMLWFLLVTISGFVQPLVSIWGLGGAALVASWNIRALMPTGHESQKSGDSELFKAAKLAGTKAKEITVGDNKATAELQLPPGQLTAKDAHGARERLASALSVPANGVRVTPNPNHHDRARLTVVPHDLLKNATPWSGPSHFGGSVMDPITIGTYEDSEPQHMFFPGDKATGRNATHYLVMGMNGAGKSAGGKVGWTELLTRRDVLLWVADPSKGKQTLGAFLEDLDWAAIDRTEAQAMVDCLPNVVRKRANELGELGYDQWEPEVYEEHGIPYLVVWIEEASSLLRDSDTIIDTAQEARSAGVSLAISLQRASVSNLPVEVRQQLGGAWVFGVKDENDATFALSDDLVEQGCDPAAWQNRKPGYNYLIGPGIDDERFTVPGRTLNLDPDRGAADAAHVITAAREFRATADPTTTAGAGAAYTNRKHRPAIEPPAPQGTSTPGTAIKHAQNATEDFSEEGQDMTPHDPFKGRLSASEDVNPPELPTNPEQDLPNDDELDLDAELPPAPIGEVFDWPTAHPSPEEARRLLRDVLAELHARGVDVFGPKDVPESFKEHVRGRTWISGQLGRMADAGELIEISQGRYRFPPTTPGLSDAA